MENKRSILIADDQASWINILSRLIKETGVENPVEAFEDGTSLEARLKKGPAPALVITDNQMPGIPGSKIIQEYAPQYSQTKFILHHGGDKFIGEYLMEEGLAFAFIQKGAESEEIINKIRSALGYLESSPTSSSQ
jgi:DNA-binding NtrC family response regulator